MLKTFLNSRLVQKHCFEKPNASLSDGFGFYCRPINVAIFFLHKITWRWVDSFVRSNLLRSVFLLISSNSGNRPVISKICRPISAAILTFFSVRGCSWCQNSLVHFHLQNASILSGSLVPKIANDFLRAQDFQGFCGLSFSWKRKKTSCANHRTLLSKLIIFNFGLIEISIHKAFIKQSWSGSFDRYETVCYPKTSLWQSAEVRLGYSVPNSTTSSFLFLFSGQRLMSSVISLFSNVTRLTRVNDFGNTEILEFTSFRPKNVSVRDGRKISPKWSSPTSCGLRILNFK